MERLEYFIRRLLLVVPTFLGITFCCFLLCQLVPGGPVEQRLMRLRGIGEGGDAGRGGQSVTESQRQALIKHFGFDKPIPVRYWRWLWHDRMGLAMYSYKFTHKTVWQLIAERFRVSLIFGIVGFVLTYLVCVPLGIAKALRDGTAFDFASSVVVFVGYAIPGFALGMLLKLLLAGTVEGFPDWFPVSGFVSDHHEQLGFLARLGDIAWHMCLPVLCYMVGSFAVLTLLMKNSLLEEVGKDYVRAVLARGGSMRLAIWGHALRNSLIPLATGIGGVLTVMFAGSVLIETVFEIPGMGALSLDAIINRDYPVFMGILALTSVLGLVGNVVSDFCYVLIDPRINFQKA